MTAMVSPRTTEVPPSPIGDLGLMASGFTPAQAIAIAELVQEATAAAAEALRHELSRWHCYLAVYLLSQIGISLLAILMIQILHDPLPVRNAAWATYPLQASRSGTPIHGEHRVNQPRFEAHQSETAPCFEKSSCVASPQSVSSCHTASDWIHGDSPAVTPACPGRAGGCV